MVRAFAGDSTITSLVPCAFVAAPFAVAVLFTPLSEAALALPAALLLAGTFYPTSHQRHGPSRPAVPRHRFDATSAACTIRGAATKCPSLLLSLQPSIPSRLFPVWSCALRRLAHNKRQWPSTTTSSCTCRAERPATPRGVFLRTTPSTVPGNSPGFGCTPTAAGR